MKFFKSLVFPVLLLAGLHGFCQEEQYDPYAKGKNDTLSVALTKLDDGALVPWLPLTEVAITGKGRVRTPEERALYNRLRYNVQKVWPYAVLAKNRFSKLQTDLAVTGDRKEQKRLVKACDEEIKTMFNKEIKNMTITQGDILIKLIDRETGSSSYEMVRELKGGITAFGYQVVAKVFGHDLKEKYDPQQDSDIEAIVQSMEYRFN